MIEDTLKERKPGDKPRFFLHDEIKEWLKDHLRIDHVVATVSEVDVTLGAKLNSSGAFTRSITSTITVSLDDDVITESHYVTQVNGIKDSIKPLVNVSEACMIKISQLEAENEHLKRRIELLENPLPV